MKVTLKQIQNSPPAFQALITEKMPAQTSFIILSLTKELNTHLANIQESCKNKEMSLEEFEELMLTEVEITNTLLSSQITFNISPLHLELIKPFCSDLK